MRNFEKTQRNPANNNPFSDDRKPVSRERRNQRKAKNQRNSFFQ